jgi:hypothetical protein
MKLEEKGAEVEEEVQEVQVEEVESEVLEGEGEILSISLHALARSPAPKTMRLVGKLEGQGVIILIDMGITHSFIDPNVARKLKLPAKEVN